MDSVGVPSTDTESRSPGLIFMTSGILTPGCRVTRWSSLLQRAVTLRLVSTVCDDQADSASKATKVS